MQAKIRRSVIHHEGIKTFPYPDSMGNITIGIGYNLSSRGVTDEWINAEYNADVNYFYHQLLTFPWFENLNLDRQIVLIDMAFMGWKRFLEFEKMIDYLSKGDYKNAYNNFRAFQNAQDSLYSQQTKNEIAGLESKREIGLRDKEIELNKLAIENQEKQRIGLLIGLGLLAIIGGLLFWQNQTRK